MTTEEKFKELLNIAIINGYVQQRNVPTEHINQIVKEKYFNINDLTLDSGAGYDGHYTISLNDLVIQTNFFDCLFKNVKGTVFTDFYFETYVNYNIEHKTNIYPSLILALKFQWIVEIHEKRNPLKWLFKQFGL